MWSVCVLPGLRGTSVRWTSVSDAMELRASLTRRQETWFASECSVSAPYPISAITLRPYSLSHLWESSSSEVCCLVSAATVHRQAGCRLNELIWLCVKNASGHTLYSKSVCSNVCELKASRARLLHLSNACAWQNYSWVGFFLLLLKSLVASIYYFFTLQLHKWQNSTELSAVWRILLQWRHLSPGPWHQPAFLSVSHCLMGGGEWRFFIYFF